MSPELVERKLQERVADAVPAIVAVYDINTGQYLYVNKAITRILGYEPEDWLEGSMEFALSIIHPEDSQKLMARNAQALEAANQQIAGGNEPIVDFEYRLKHKNGSWRWLHTEGTVFERTEGKVSLILNVSLDITDRKVAEIQLRKSLKILEGIISH